MPEKSPYTVARERRDEALMALGKAVLSADLSTAATAELPDAVVAAIRAAEKACRAVALQ